MGEGVIMDDNMYKIVEVKEHLDYNGECYLKPEECPFKNNCCIAFDIGCKKIDKCNHLISHSIFSPKHNHKDLWILCSNYE